MNVNVKRLSDQIALPAYATAGAAGFDVCAAEDVTLAPGEVTAVPLGLAFEIPEGYVMYLMPRSGLSKKTKLRQPNSVGVIDSDYRGEVKLLLENTDSKESYHIETGDRIGQGVIQEVPHVDFVEADELSETKRGSGGFGSTGV
ncbi:deoxyuridine 5'-triphosphate nucleotidohydrolase [Salsuginibacillus halophilus]|uniref:Deoxyuridine 5'-triphosphate nucleotidohydrolase n=2 Tax=Salsuginibacillus halophilus TaxID=517424 RepID=A0A2P8HQQ3_9BACI|nr:dUTP diphosphatase [Salsuginibacillus halophilus]PSL48547.1 deoxyuridine 5'-triphosphate nucleotidohydrolase [Salsuginibacillus halophilus]